MEVTHDRARMNQSAALTVFHNALYVREGSRVSGGGSEAAAPAHSHCSSAPRPLQASPGQEASGKAELRPSVVAK